MFQRRLKIVLIVLLVFSGLLMLRALQLQVFGKGEWSERAAKSLERPVLTETTRGRILDYKGREVAIDVPCMDLCVDYRAILQPKAEEKWLRQLAARRLTDRLGDAYTKVSRTKRLEMIETELPAAQATIDAMWATIARVSGKGTEWVDEQRRTIVQRVEMRRRYLWVHRWKRAVDRQKEAQAAPDAPWYQRWIMGDSAAEFDLDSFDLVVDEQREAHVILADVNSELVNFFGKNPELYPGLVLRPGVKREYPYHEAGCHLIGHLAKVDRDDLRSDDDRDELRKYWPNDVMGKSGVEALAEQLLRGSRGRVLKVDGVEKERLEPRPGKDVRLTIDIELQREIQALFRHVAISEGDNAVSYHTMHGAAVVIDVETNEVRALASYPDYDLDTLDENYAKLAMDGLNAPLLNRATQVAREPGSTAKPIVGLTAITNGLITPTKGIECTGYLRIDGKKYGVGKCWVVNTAKSNGLDYFAHHPFPSGAPHKGHDGNPDGFLTFSDALERSCNVYFETLGNQMKIEGLSAAFRHFGLGRPTGIGIAERSGYVPADIPVAPAARQSTSWFASIGQGNVAATPIQMANVAATIARDGIWMKPKLLASGTPLPTPKPSSQPIEKQAPAEDVIDLHLSKAGLQAAKEGMLRVVNSPAGTGTAIAQREGEKRFDPAMTRLRIAGKTGTAQASRIKVPVTDASGNEVKDESGKTVMKVLDPVMHGQSGGEIDWYRAADKEGKRVNHAWFMGFAPADHPKVAFVVLVEYGESGGATAGRVARHVIEACVEHGYLPASSVSNPN